MIPHLKLCKEQLHIAKFVYKIGDTIAVKSVWSGGNADTLMHILSDDGLGSAVAI